jgi:hypothetical protein
MSKGKYNISLDVDVDVSFDEGTKEWNVSCDSPKLDCRNKDLAEAYKAFTASILEMVKDKAFAPEKKGFKLM